MKTHRKNGTKREKGSEEEGFLSLSGWRARWRLGVVKLNIERMKGWMMKRWVRGRDKALSLHHTHTHTQTHTQTQTHTHTHTHHTHTHTPHTHTHTLSSF